MNDVESFVIINTSTKSLEVNEYLDDGLYRCWLKLRPDCSYQEFKQRLSSYCIGSEPKQSWKSKMKTNIAGAMYPILGLSSQFHNFIHLAWTVYGYTFTLYQIYLHRHELSLLLYFVRKVVI